MGQIDRSSPIPIYHQLKALIQDRIASGLWGPGDCIPTQKEMCQEHGVSRAPVRQALNELVQEGTLVRRPGLGTFVNDQATTPSPAQTTVRLMTSDGVFQSEVLPDVSRAWKERHPDQEIGFQVTLVKHSQFYNELSQAVGSGTAPDIAMVDCVLVAGLAESGFIYDLESLNSGWDHAELVKDLYPAFVAANSCHGRLYGLPVTADTALLWYRKDWFAQEGLEPPRNWDDLLHAAQYFLQPDVRARYNLVHPLVFPGGTSGGEATVYTLMPFVWSASEALHAGGSFIDGPGTRRALTFLRELVTHYRVVAPEVATYRENTSPRLFAKGKVAMALGGSYEGTLIRSISGWEGEAFLERVGCVAPPAAPGGPPVSTVGGNSYVVLRQCHQPRLAMDILEVATDPAVIGHQIQSLWLNSPHPSFDTQPAPEVAPLLAQIKYMIASSRARPSIPEYVKVSRQLQAMFEAALSTTTPIDEIVARTTEFIRVLTDSPFLPLQAPPNRSF
ncbi:MAG: extracellular solute-binding protein [Anaerolineae bacterium]|nr:extracellular solute-binding protein [Anaerolineae bacterium]